MSYKERLDKIDLYNSNKIKEYVYLDGNDLDRLKSSIKMQQSGKGMNHADTKYANVGSRKVTQGITGVDMEDDENAPIMAAHKKYRGLGKDDLLKAIYRLRTLNVYFKNLRKGKNNPEKLKQSDIVRQIRALTKKYGKEILGLGISVTDAANIFPGMQRIVDASKPLIQGGRAIPVHQSLPSSGSIARSLSTGYDSVHSRALSERSFESMGLDDIRRYINDQNELRRYGYGMTAPSVSSTGSSSGSNPTHTSTAHDSDEESDGSWGTTWGSDSEEGSTGDENVIPQSLVYTPPESEGSEVSFHPRWEHSPVYQPPQTGRGKRKGRGKNNLIPLPVFAKKWRKV